MTKGDKRRSRRKYRVRYDRIVIFLLIIAAIVVLISSCTTWLKFKNEKGPEDKKKPDKGTPAITTTTGTDAAANEQTTTTTAPEDTVLSGYQLVSVDKDQMYKGDLVLVNAQYEYKFLDGDITPVTVWNNLNGLYECGDMVTSYDNRALTQLNAMIEAYAAENWLSTTDIFVQYGYRTFEEQVQFHASGRSKTFEAGHCDYHTGRAIDFFRFNNGEGSAYAYFAADQWFTENAGKYGFIVRYPIGKEEQTGEKGRTYTYRFVGAPHSVYINDNGLCLEEYIDLLKTHNNENQLNISANGHSYGVYYVAAGDGEKCDVPVPTDKQYVISGNNADGFIVTVSLS